MKKNLPLLVGIALPIIFIIIMSVVAFGPSWFIKPAHNFVYTNDNREYYDYAYAYRNRYEVVGGKVTLVPLPLKVNNGVPVNENRPMEEAPKLFLYDVSNDTAHEINLTEALALNLDPGPSSPDGYTVEYRYGNNGIFELFGSRSEGSGYFVVKNNSAKRLAGFVTDRYGYYRGDFKFLGWVK